MIDLPKLNYPLNALEPYIDEKTVETHYTKHHQWYVNKLNDLIKWTEFEDMKLEDIIMKASGPIFNNAAQVWNHTFYWNGLSPNAEWIVQNAELSVMKKIEETRWSFDNFKSEFTNSAIWNFGSGWTWLVKDNNWELKIINTSNAANPIIDWFTPLLTVDVWEHAYYLKYQNRRPEYLENRWNLIDWNRVEKLYIK